MKSNVVVSILRQTLVVAVLWATLMLIFDVGVGVGFKMYPVDKTVGAPTRATYHTLQAMTVRVEVLFKIMGEPRLSRGTGVIVTRRLGQDLHTYVWTAAHVVSHVRKPDGTFDTVKVVRELRAGGLKYDTLTETARVIAYSDADVGEDLALLEVLKPNWTQEHNTVVFSDVYPVEVGTPLISVGCPFGYVNCVSLGIMSQTDRIIRPKVPVFDQTTCICYPGSSGGGIYTYDGYCVGLVVRTAGPGLNMIVPTRRIHAWANKMGVLWAVDPSVAIPTITVRTPTPLSDTPPEKNEDAPKILTGGPK
jgi:S1-C subfamily serine protease